MGGGVTTKLVNDTFIYSIPFWPILIIKILKTNEAWKHHQSRSLSFSIWLRQIRCYLLHQGSPVPGLWPTSGLWPIQNRAVWAASPHAEARSLTCMSGRLACTCSSGSICINQAVLVQPSSPSPPAGLPSHKVWGPLCYTSLVCYYTVFSCANIWNYDLDFLVLKR